MVLVFSYGSNSISQLQARVENKTLKAVPARAPGWQRIFCRKTERWEGAAASMAPKGKAVTHGAVVDLTEVELSLLDKYEGGYTKNNIDVDLYLDGQWTNKSATAIVYISDNSTWLHPPSEQYLTAIHVMLREQFHTISPNHMNEIEICGIISEKLETVYTWRYPGSTHLSLPALCVEVNAKRTHKWVMPQTITDIRTELKGVNVHSTAQLAVWISRRHLMNDKGRDLSLVDDEAVHLFKELLQLDPVVVDTQITPPSSASSSTAPSNDKESLEFRYGVRIFKLGEPELKVRCSEVSLESILSSDEIKTACSIAHSALRNFRSIEGFGRAIAAPQVGHLIRMIAMNLKGEEITLFNPVIVQRSDDTLTMWDDCLSFPDLMCCVQRHKHISIMFTDSKGVEVTWNDCTSDISELLQHEIDHLDGILAVDRAVKPNSSTNDQSGDKKEKEVQFTCEAVINRSDWLANKDLYNSLVDFHY